MYYEINISLNGEHFFATAQRSITGINKLKKVYKVFKEKFPESEGYKLTVTQWDSIGMAIDMEKEMV